MDNNVLWYIEEQIERTIDNLKRRNMAGFFVKDEVELEGLLKELIDENSIVGVGDSKTLFETGTIDFLRKGNYTFLDKYREGITSEEKNKSIFKTFLLILLCVVQMP